MTRIDTLCLRKAWLVLCQLVHFLDLRVALLVPDGRNHLILLHLARLAESLTRRWLVLNACQLPDWPKPMVTKPRSIKTRNNPRPRIERQSSTRFPILEPRPAPLVMIFHAATSDRPAGYALQRPVPTGAGSSNLWAPVFNPANLQRRIRVLRAVIEDPSAQTLRMARWLARAAIGAKRHVRCPHPMRVGRPPGASRRQKRQDPQRQAVLTELNRLAHDAVYRRILDG